MENNNPTQENQSQPIPQYPSPNLQQPTKLKKFLLPIIGVLLSLTALAGGFYLLNQSNKNKTVQENTTEVLQPEKEKVIYNITFPFIRNGDLYVYKNGEEKLILAKKAEITNEVQNGSAYPVISPNGKYVAFIYYDNVKKIYGMGGFTLEENKLAVFDLETGKLDLTKYERQGSTTSLKWNEDNLLEFGNIVYDPSSKKEVANYPLGSEKSYPYKDIKKVEKVGSVLYLIDNKTNTKRKLTSKLEEPIIDPNNEERFESWSPSGRYALVTGYEDDRRNWVAIDTESPNLEAKIAANVWAGGAGGDSSIGTQWYFEKGFVVYCQGELFFVDGSKPLKLLTRGGGGCFNEDGFVATSPNGNYALVKTEDKYELHGIDGSKTNVKIEEDGKMINFKHFKWINNDYMVFYKSVFSSFDDRAIYIYDRKTNAVNKVLDNGYLYDN